MNEEQFEIYKKLSPDAKFIFITSVIKLSGTSIPSAVANKIMQQVRDEATEIVDYVRSKRGKDIKNMRSYEDKLRADYNFPNVGLEDLLRRQQKFPNVPKDWR